MSELKAVAAEDGEQAAEWCTRGCSYHWRVEVSGCRNAVVILQFDGGVSRGAARVIRPEHDRVGTVRLAPGRTSLSARRPGAGALEVRLLRRAPPRVHPEAIEDGRDHAARSRPSPVIASTRAANSTSATGGVTALPYWRTFSRWVPSTR